MYMAIYVYLSLYYIRERKEEQKNGEGRRRCPPSPAASPGRRSLSACAEPSHLPAGIGARCR